MNTNNATSSNPWPELPYAEFMPTMHLLHMGSQAIGKLKLYTPFEPHWDNVPLWLTSRGLTTGLIPYQSGSFSVDMDLIAHEIRIKTSWGKQGGFSITPSSVAQFVQTLLNILHGIGIDLKINPLPQEIPNPIPFDQDTQFYAYNATLANAWWRILISSYRVMQRYHAVFLGRTPPIGFMWGTFDLRDVRYNGTLIKPVAPNTDFLRRNAMDAALIEAGWWCGNPAYPRPAYYAFTYPQPAGIEQAKINPTAAHWDSTMGEFLLDYDVVRQSKNPEEELYAFLTSTYEVGAKLAGWDPKLIGTGKPV